MSPLTDKLTTICFMHSGRVMVVCSSCLRCVLHHVVTTLARSTTTRVEALPIEVLHDLQLVLGCCEKSLLRFATFHYDVGRRAGT